MSALAIVSLVSHALHCLWSDKEGRQVAFASSCQSAVFSGTRVDGEHKYNMRLLKPSTVQAMMQNFETQSALISSTQPDFCRRKHFCAFPEVTILSF